MNPEGLADGWPLLFWQPADDGRGNNQLRDGQGRAVLADSEVVARDALFHCAGGSFVIYCLPKSDKTSDT